MNNPLDLFAQKLRAERDRQEDRYGDKRFGRRSDERDTADGAFRDRRNGNDRQPRRDDRRGAPERPAHPQDRRPGRYEDGRRPDRNDDPRAFPRNDRRPDGRRPDQRSDRRSGDRRHGDAPRRGRGRGED